MNVVRAHSVLFVACRRSLPRLQHNHCKVIKSQMPMLNRRSFFTGEHCRNDKKHDQVDQGEEDQGDTSDQNKLETKVVDLEKQVEQLKIAYVSSVADTDNVRKRLQKEIQKAQEFGMEKLVKNLFPIVDTINYCLQYKPDFEHKEHSSKAEAKSAFEALETTKSNLLKVLKEVCEVEETAPNIGDAFDPNQHNAILEVDPPKRTSIPPGKIGLVLKNGWRRKDTLLRPADVGVVKYHEQVAPNVKIPENAENVLDGELDRDQDEEDDGFEAEGDAFKEEEEEENVKKEAKEVKEAKGEKEKDKKEEEKKYTKSKLKAEKKW